MVGWREADKKVPHVEQAADRFTSVETLAVVAFLLVEGPNSSFVRIGRGAPSRCARAAPAQCALLQGGARWRRQGGKSASNAPDAPGTGLAL
jgi:hypothetical protein